MEHEGSEDAAETAERSLCAGKSLQILSRDIRSAEALVGMSQSLGMLSQFGVRLIVINPSDTLELERYGSNVLRSQNYTWWAFLLHVLLAHFSRFPALIQLVLCLLHLPPTSLLHGLLPGDSAAHVRMPPLLLLLVTLLHLAVFAVVELQTYIQSRYCDRICNQHNKCSVLDAQQPRLRRIAWQDVRVGNVLRIYENEHFPADTILLNIGLDENCLIDMSALDGVPGFKKKTSTQETQGDDSLRILHSLKGRVICENPCNSADLFRCSLKLDAHPRVRQLDSAYFVPRGSVLRSGVFVDGLVVYTGVDTVIGRQINFKAKTPSRTRVEKQIDTFIFYLWMLYIATTLIVEGLTWITIFSPRSSMTAKAPFLCQTIPAYAVTATIQNLLNATLLLPLALHMHLDFRRLIFWPYTFRRKTYSSLVKESQAVSQKQSGTERILAKNGLKQRFSLLNSAALNTISNSYSTSCSRLDPLLQRITCKHAEQSRRDACLSLTLMSRENHTKDDVPFSASNPKSSLSTHYKAVRPFSSNEEIRRSLWKKRFPFDSAFLSRKHSCTIADTPFGTAGSTFLKAPHCILTNTTSLDAEKGLLKKRVRRHSSAPVYSEFGLQTCGTQLSAASTNFYYRLKGQQSTRVFRRRTFHFLPSRMPCFAPRKHSCLGTVEFCDKLLSDFFFPRSHIAQNFEQKEVVKGANLCILHTHKLQKSEFLDVKKESDERFSKVAVPEYDCCCTQKKRKPTPLAVKNVSLGNTNDQLVPSTVLQQAGSSSRLTLLPDNVSHNLSAMSPLAVDHHSVQRSKLDCPFSERRRSCSEPCLKFRPNDPSRRMFAAKESSQLHDAQQRLHISTATCNESENCSSFVCNKQMQDVALKWGKKVDCAEGGFQSSLAVHACKLCTKQQFCFVRNPRCLDSVGCADFVIFDKTNTLTTGEVRLAAFSVCGLTYDNRCGVRKTMSGADQTNYFMPKYKGHERLPLAETPSTLRFPHHSLRDLTCSSIKSHVTRPQKDSFTSFPSGEALAAPSKTPDKVAFHCKLPNAAYVQPPQGCDVTNVNNCENGAVWQVEENWRGTGDHCKRLRDVDSVEQQEIVQEMAVALAVCNQAISVSSATSSPYAERESSHLVDRCKKRCKQQAKAKRLVLHGCRKLLEHTEIERRPFDYLATESGTSSQPYQHMRRFPKNIPPEVCCTSTTDLSTPGVWDRIPHNCKRCQDEKVVGSGELSFKVEAPFFKIFQPDKKLYHIHSCFHQSCCRDDQKKPCPVCIFRSASADVKVQKPILSNKGCTQAADENRSDTLHRASAERQSYPYSHRFGVFTRSCTKSSLSTSASQFSREKEQTSIRADNPVDICLLEMASRMGITLLKKTDSSATLLQTRYEPCSFIRKSCGSRHFAVPERRTPFQKHRVMSRPCETPPVAIIPPVQLHATRRHAQDLMVKESVPQYQAHGATKWFFEREVAAAAEQSQDRMLRAERHRSACFRCLERIKASAKAERMSRRASLQGLCSCRSGQTGGGCFSHNRLQRFVDPVEMGDSSRRMRFPPQFQCLGKDTPCNGVLGATTRENDGKTALGERTRQNCDASEFRAECFLLKYKLLGLHPPNRHRSLLSVVVQCRTDPKRAVLYTRGDVNDLAPRCCEHIYLKQTANENASCRTKQRGRDGESSLCGAIGTTSTDASQGNPYSKKGFETPFETPQKMDLHRKNIAEADKTLSGIPNFFDAALEPEASTKTNLHAHPISGASSHRMLSTDEAHLEETAHFQMDFSQRERKCYTSVGECKYTTRTEVEDFFTQLQASKGAPQQLKNISRTGRQYAEREQRKIIRGRKPERFRGENSPLGEVLHRTELSDETRYNSWEIQRTLLHADQLLKRGLRPLLLARRTLTTKEVTVYRRALADASNNPESLQDLHIQHLVNRFERELELLGVVGIQEELRAQAKETISDLRKAGARVWMATGDCAAAALAVAYQAGLLGSMAPDALTAESDIAVESSQQLELLRMQREKEAAQAPSVVSVCKQHYPHCERKPCKPDSTSKSQSFSGARSCLHVPSKLSEHQFISSQGDEKKSRFHTLRDHQCLYSSKLSNVLRPRKEIRLAAAVQRCGSTAASKVSTEGGNGLGSNLTTSHHPLLLERGSFQTQNLGKRGCSWRIFHVASAIGDTIHQLDAANGSSVHSTSTCTGKFFEGIESTGTRTENLMTPGAPLHHGCANTPSTNSTSSQFCCPLTAELYKNVSLKQKSDCSFEGTVREYTTVHPGWWTSRNNDLRAAAMCSKSLSLETAKFATKSPPPPQHAVAVEEDQLTKKQEVSDDIRTLFTTSVGMRLLKNFHQVLAEKEVGVPICMLMEGDLVDKLLGNKDLQSLVVWMACQCNTLVCCKMSSAQKAVLVRALHSVLKPAPVTVTVGDGWNDVAMLKAATVGILMAAALSEEVGPKEGEGLLEKIISGCTSEGEANGTAPSKSAASTCSPIEFSRSGLRCVFPGKSMFFKGWDSAADSVKTESRRFFTQSDCTQHCFRHPRTGCRRLSKVFLGVKAWSTMQFSRDANTLHFSTGSVLRRNCDDTLSKGGGVHSLSPIAKLPAVLVGSSDAVVADFTCLQQLLFERGWCANYEACTIAKLAIANSALFSMPFFFSISSSLLNGALIPPYGLSFSNLLWVCVPYISCMLDATKVPSPVVEHVRYLYFISRRTLLLSREQLQIITGKSALLSFLLSMVVHHVLKSSPSVGVGMLGDVDKSIFLLLVCLILTTSRSCLISLRGSFIEKSSAFFWFCFWALCIGLILLILPQPLLQKFLFPFSVGSPPLLSGWRVLSCPQFFLIVFFAYFCEFSIFLGSRALAGRRNNGTALRAILLLYRSLTQKGFSPLEAATKTNAVADPEKILRCNLRNMANLVVNGTSIIDGWPTQARRLYLYFHTLKHLPHDSTLTSQHEKTHINDCTVGSYRRSSCQNQQQKHRQVESRSWIGTSHSKSNADFKPPCCSHPVPENGAAMRESNKKEKATWNTFVSSCSRSILAELFSQEGRFCIKLNSTAQRLVQQLGSSGLMCRLQSFPECRDQRLRKLPLCTGCNGTFPTCVISASTYANDYPYYSNGAPYFPQKSPMLKCQCFLGCRRRNQKASNFESWWNLRIPNFGFLHAAKRPSSSQVVHCVDCSRFSSKYTDITTPTTHAKHLGLQGCCKTDPSLLYAHEETPFAHSAMVCRCMRCFAWPDKKLLEQIDASTFAAVVSTRRKKTCLTSSWPKLETPVRVPTGWGKDNGTSANCLRRIGAQESNYSRVLLDWIQEQVPRFSSEAASIKATRTVPARSLINGMSLCFRESGLEADYQAARRGDLSRYRNAFRVSLVALLVFCLVHLVYCLIRQQQQESTSFLFHLIASTIPYIPIMLLLVATFGGSSRRLLVDKFDTTVTVFVLATIFAKCISDFFIAADGFQISAMVPVVVFIILPIPFTTAALINLVFTVCTVTRYIISYYAQTRFCKEVCAAAGKNAFYHAQGLSKTPEFRSGARFAAVGISAYSGFQENVSDNLSSTAGSRMFDFLKESSLAAEQARLSCICLWSLLSYLPVLLGIQALTGFAGYRFEYTRRKRFLLDFQVKAAAKRQREILNTMLPSFVVEKMLSSRTQPASDRNFSDRVIPSSVPFVSPPLYLTVMFCDVADFHKLVHALPSPQSIVKLLDALFLCFDKIADHFNLVKIETVFETYLAAAGLNQTEELKSTHIKSLPAPNGNFSRHAHQKCEEQEVKKKFSHWSEDSTTQPHIQLPSMKYYSRDLGREDESWQRIKCIENRHRKTRLLSETTSGLTKKYSRCNTVQSTRWPRHQLRFHPCSQTIQSKEKTFYRADTQAGIIKQTQIEDVKGKQLTTSQLIRSWRLHPDWCKLTLEEYERAQRSACNAVEMALEMLRVSQHIKYETSTEGRTGKFLENTWAGGTTLLRTDFCGCTISPRRQLPHNLDTDDAHNTRKKSSCYSVGEECTANYSYAEKANSTVHQMVTPRMRDGHAKATRPWRHTNYTDSRPSSAALSNFSSTAPAKEAVLLKIGLHSGIVISGVVGVKKPQYALFGDTVNTASRMKSSGAPGSIHASATTHAFIEDTKCSWQPRLVDVKGKGIMKTFLLDQKSFTSTPVALQSPAALSKKCTLMVAHESRSQQQNQQDRQQLLGIDKGIFYSRVQSRLLLGKWLRARLMCRRIRTLDRVPMSQNTIPGNFSDDATKSSNIISSRWPSNSKDMQNYNSLHMTAFAAHENRTLSARGLAAGSKVAFSNKEKCRTSFISTESNNGSNVQQQQHQDTCSSGNYPVKIRKVSARADITTCCCTLLQRRKAGSFRLLLHKPEKRSFSSHPLRKKRLCKRGANRVFTTSRSITEPYYNISNAGQKKFTGYIHRGSRNMATSGTEHMKQTSNVPTSALPVTLQTALNDSSVSNCSVVSGEMLSKKRVSITRKCKPGVAAKGNAFTVSCSTMEKQKKAFQALPLEGKGLFGTEKEGEGKRNLAQICRSGLFLPRMQLNWIFLKFQNHLENKYYHHYYTDKTNISSVKHSLLIFLIAFVQQTLVFVSTDRISATKNMVIMTDRAFTWTVRCLVAGWAFFMWLFFHYRAQPSKMNVPRMKRIIFLLNTFFIVAAMTSGITSPWNLTNSTGNPEWLYIDTIELYFFITVIHHNSGLLIQQIVYMNILLLLVTVTLLAVVVKPTKCREEAFFTVTVFVAINALSSYFKEYLDRQTFIVDEEANFHERRGRELLANMLPRQVLEEFRNDNLKLAYLHNCIFFLFADICGFTAWSRTVPAQEVLGMLQSLFSVFDSDSNALGLYKLCTIGDAYVVVTEPLIGRSYPEEDQRQGAKKLLLMARRMIANVVAVRQKLRLHALDMRIGLHRGSCVGGVIGSKRLRYDLWGTDVLIGNKVESNGVAGKVCCSEEYKRYFVVECVQLRPYGTLKGKKLIFTPHKRIQVNDRVIPLYLIHEEADSNRCDVGCA